MILHPGAEGVGLQIGQSGWKSCGDHLSDPRRTVGTRPVGVSHDQLVPLPLGQSLELAGKLVTQGAL